MYNVSCLTRAVGWRSSAVGTRGPDHELPWRITESSAVLMASGEAQAANGYGVAIVSMSAGMSNAMNRLTHAFMEHVPLLVISGQHPAERRPFIVGQGFDVAALARPVTKWQVQVAPGTDVAQLIAKALFIANEAPWARVRRTAGRRRPRGNPRPWSRRLRAPVLVTTLPADSPCSPWTRSSSPLEWIMGRALSEWLGWVPGPAQPANGPPSTGNPGSSPAPTSRAASTPSTTRTCMISSTSASVIMQP